MNAGLPWFGAAIAALSLTSCVYPAPPPPYPGPAYVAPGPAYYDGFYDGYYGPVYEGYWAADGFFYYRGHDRRFYRGDPAHFSREARPGYHQFHVRGQPPRGGDRR
jgi:hypothetical protein